ncbi:GbpC/Spa domain-containing protein [Limosilactobacillus reuteri]|uniref:GbpC/Spa domain-containing protein n=1 Tax=Limosilactobacillus reuteri TaxID=1598 RepID=UPI001E5FFF3B|nr:GbpC/Spa domain-containing protein [Limosilactobacillus reuteri]UFK69191.1 hypothetical protein IVR12_02302 [Limosilactobacillus reuteri]
MGYFFTNTLSTQKQKYADWKESVSLNKDGVTIWDIKNNLQLNHEPNAAVNVKQLVAADATAGNGNVLYYKPSTQTSGDFVQVTYTNLDNSYIIDSNGQKQKIAKIVRTFSDLAKSASASSISFKKGILSNDWRQPNLAGDDSTALLINTDPANGAMYLNALGITVEDHYYDENGNQIDGDGGYYVLSSINNNDGFDNHHEHVKAPNNDMSAIAVHGSSVSVQSDGSLSSNIGNSLQDVHSDGSYSDSNNTSTFNNWDNVSSDYFYFGSGLMQYTSNPGKLRFYTGMSGENSNDDENAFWFTINTILPKVPVNTEVHYHYNTSQAYLLTPL